jgi:hypothetical protein
MSDNDDIANAPSHPLGLILALSLTLVSACSGESVTEPGYVRLQTEARNCEPSGRCYFRLRIEGYPNREKVTTVLVFQAPHEIGAMQFDKATPQRVRFRPVDKPSSVKDLSAEWPRYEVLSVEYPKLNY